MTQVERATTVATPSGPAPSERGQGRQLESPNSLPDVRSLPKHQKQQPQTESQRIYWQQWLLTSSSGTSSNDKNTSRHQRQRRLITSSAAVRIDRFSAKSIDVTQLLRKTLHLGHSHGRPQPSSSSSQQERDDNDDSLVLVATIHDLPSNYVQFEHEVTYADVITREEQKEVTRPTPRLGGGGGGGGNGGVGEPFHIVQTLQPDDSPLMKRDELLDYIQTHILDVVATTASDELEPIVGGVGDNENGQEDDDDDDDAPQPTVTTHFYYVPTNQQQQPSGMGGSNGGSGSAPGSSMGSSSTTIPACIELDGYVTSMDESYNSYNNENDHDRRKNGGDDGDGDSSSSFDGSDEEEEDMEDEIYGFGSIDSAEAWDRRRRRSRQLRYRHHHHQQQLGSGIPSIPPKSSLVGPTATSLTTTDSSSNSPRRSQEQIARRKERRAMRRYLQISQSHASPTCLSGFVLKQSTKDKHVWKRVYCVLTDDYLWFVPRLQTYKRKKKRELTKRQNEYDEENRASGRDGYDYDDDNDDNLIKMAPHHGRIMLSRALLIEGMEDMQGSSLFRIPNSWEVVTGKGVTHTFRVQSPSLARQWVHAIRQRLLECYEQSLMQNAELIITDEVVARNHRFRSVAVDPLIAKWEEQQLNEEKEEKNENGNRIIPPIEDEIPNPLPRLLHRLPVHSKEQFQANVLRFGMDVASYKERCLHLQSLLLSQAGEGGSSRDVARVDSAKLSQAIWENASHLLSCAKDISSQVKIIVGPGTNMRSSSMMSLISVESSSSVDEQRDKNPADMTTSHHSHSSRSLETLCRHIEYVITGQFHHHEHVVDSNNSNHDSSVGRTTHRPSHHNSNDPPPMDLFDMLLKELQNIATQ